MYDLSEGDVSAIKDMWNWHKQNSDTNLMRTGFTQNESINRENPPIAAILLQDCYGGGRAIALQMAEAESNDTWQIEILGVNPVVDSQFILKFYEDTVDGGGNPSTTDLFSTSPISIVQTAEQLKAIIVASSNGLLNDKTVDVQIGNPYYSPDLIVEPRIQHDDIEDPEDLPPSAPSARSFVGTWIVKITWNNSGSTLDMVAVEDLEHNVYMRGLSAVASRKVVDVPTTEIVVVRDRFELARISPARRGVKVGCIYFPSWGYVIMTVGYRDMNVDLSSVGEFDEVEEEPTPEDEPSP